MSFVAENANEPEMHYVFNPSDVFDLNGLPNLPKHLTAEEW